MAEGHPTPSPAFCAAQLAACKVSCDQNHQSSTARNICYAGCVAEFAGCMGLLPPAIIADPVLDTIEEVNFFLQTHPAVAIGTAVVLGGGVIAVVVFLGPGVGLACMVAVA